MTLFGRLSSERFSWEKGPSVFVSPGPGDYDAEASQDRLLPRHRGYHPAILGTSSPRFRGPPEARSGHQYGVKNARWGTPGPQYYAPRSQTSFGGRADNMDTSYCWEEERATPLCSTCWWMESSKTAGDATPVRDGTSRARTFKSRDRTSLLDLHLSKVRASISETRRALRRVRSTGDLNVEASVELHSPMHPAGRAGSTPSSPGASKVPLLALASAASRLRPKAMYTKDSSLRSEMSTRAPSVRSSSTHSVQSSTASSGCFSHASNQRLRLANRGGSTMNMNEVETNSCSHVKSSMTEKQKADIESAFLSSLEGCDGMVPKIAVDRGGTRGLLSQENLDYDCTRHGIAEVFNDGGGTYNQCDAYVGPKNAPKRRRYDDVACKLLAMALQDEEELVVESPAQASMPLRRPAFNDDLLVLCDPGDSVRLSLAPGCGSHRYEEVYSSSCSSQSDTTLRQGREASTSHCTPHRNQSCCLQEDNTEGAQQRSHLVALQMEPSGSEISDNHKSCISRYPSVSRGPDRAQETSKAGISKPWRQQLAQFAAEQIQVLERVIQKESESFLSASMRPDDMPTGRNFDQDVSSAVNIPESQISTVRISQTAVQGPCCSPTSHVVEGDWVTTTSSSNPCIDGVTGTFTHQPAKPCLTMPHEWHVGVLQLEETPMLPRPPRELPTKPRAPRKVFSTERTATPNAETITVNASQECSRAARPCCTSNVKSDSWMLRTCLLVWRYSHEGRSSQ